METNNEVETLDLPTPETADVQPAVAPEPDSRTAKDDSPIKLLRKQLSDLKAENEGYKRRDEEARKARLSDEERVREEVETLRAERDRIASENMRRKVASEYKLPDAFINRLVGSDEDSLRADAEELASLLPKPKIGSVSNPVSSNAGISDVRRTFKSSDIERMPQAEFERRRGEIMQAYKEGRVTN